MTSPSPTPGGAATRPRLEAAMATTLAVLGQVEVVTGDHLGGIGDPTSTAPRLLLALLVIAATAPLAWRRRRPLTTLAAIAAALSVQLLLLTPSLSLIAGLLPLLLATLAVAGSSSWRSRLTGLVLALATQGVFALAIPEERVPAEAFFGTFVILGSWLLGLATSTRVARADAALAQTRARAERDQAAAAATLADERARIARELHDVIAHGVAVMGVQAAAARLVLARDPATATATLLAVEAQARESIAELQLLLTVLRATDDDVERAPQPGLGDLPDLLATMRRAGLAVELLVSGTPARLPAGTDLTAYRLVQEALTNTLTHAGPVAARVHLSWSAAALAIDVEDAGPPRTDPLPRGHGLVGMAERAGLHGGTVDVAARPTGGVSVHAVLPLGRP